MTAQIEQVVPRAVLSLRTEANLSVVNPWFEKSLSVPGDIAEVGCYRGTMALKFAFWVRALHQDKIVFAFDTFKGFTVDDSVGDTRIGAYRDNDNAEDELWKWAMILPIVPVKGDARKTCSIYLARPLSFLWLDLDIADLLGPTFRSIEHLLTPQTIIGLDDYGRPGTPSVKPWADSVEHVGRWRKLAEDHSAFIAFYQRG